MKIERKMTPMAFDEEKYNDSTEEQDVQEETTNDSESVEVEEENDNNQEDEVTVETLGKELQEEKDKYLRLYAEFQNYRNRTIKEKTETYNNATAKCIEEILPVVDDFERALAQECSDLKYKEGIENILKRFKNILEKLGVKEIEALGQPFDPNIHHAIQQVPSDQYESDTVCNVFQKGYTLGERLIRPAMVQVVE